MSSSASQTQSSPVRIPSTLALPVALWFLLFLVAPLVIISVYSFATRGVYGGVVYRFTWDNFARASDWLYLGIFWSSLKLAALTTVSCLILGYPMAYAMARSRPSIRTVLLVAVVVPFWTNFVVRAYALKTLLADDGPVNALLLALGWVAEPIAFANSDFSVWLGMVSNYLPFMVLPLYVALEKFDFTLVEAAKDLGASRIAVLTRVMIPLTRTGIVSGIVFVFTPALGEFVIPDLLGGARMMLVGNLITEQFLKSRDWPFGSALSLVLILTVAACLGIYFQMAVRHAQKRGI